MAEDGARRAGEGGRWVGVQARGEQGRELRGEEGKGEKRRASRWGRGLTERGEREGREQERLLCRFRETEREREWRKR